MNVWTFVLLVIMAAMAFELIRQRNLARSGHVEDAEGKLHRTTTIREETLQREVEDLRERVKVLERIATDDRETKRLAADIERLRDE